MPACVAGMLAVMQSVPRDIPTVHWSHFFYSIQSWSDCVSLTFVDYPSFICWLHSDDPEADLLLISFLLTLHSVPLLEITWSVLYLFIGNMGSRKQYVPFPVLCDRAYSEAVISLVTLPGSDWETFHSPPFGDSVSVWLILFPDGLTVGSGEHLLLFCLQASEYVLIPVQSGCRSDLYHYSRYEGGWKSQ